MSKIAVMGREGSDYRKKVDAWLGKVPFDQAHAVFNYGLQGQKLEAFMGRRENARLSALPIINHVQYGNKMECVMAVRNVGMSAPMSWKYRQREDIDTNNLIVKPYYSLGGKGVRRIKSLDEITEEERRTHYIQEEIKNRRYEMRVIGAAWMDPQEWRFMKRVHDGGEEVLAWNNHNGGRFITVNQPHGGVFDRLREDVATMFSLFNYGFGAVDFIIQNNPGGNLKHYFIEWNLAPGWSMEKTEEFMKRCFLDLQEFDMEFLEAFAEGIILKDIHEGGRDRPFRQRGGAHGGPRLHDLNAPPLMDWGEMLDLERRERDGELSLFTVAKKFYGPVLIYNASTHVMLDEAGLHGQYFKTMCANCEIDLYLYKGAYTFYCPCCGYEMKINL